MTRITPLTLAAVAALSASACFDRDLTGKPCNDDHPCLDGFVCAAGSCLPEGEGCADDTDCDAPATCTDGQCVHPDPDCVDADGDQRGPGCDAGDDCDDEDAARFTTVSAFVDGDTDGVGAGAAVDICTDGTIPAGHAATADDCDDEDAAVAVLAPAFVDADRDGVGTGEPVEVCTDGVALPAGFAPVDGDCDDDDAAVFASLTAFVDGDTDGVGAGALVDICSDGVALPSGFSATGTDCDDADAAVFASLTAFVDGDGDGIGAGDAVTLCTAGTLPAGHANGAGDNCVAVANADQRDDDDDGAGDACDVCPADVDADQLDIGETAIGGTADGVGDVCDPRPTLGGDRVALFDTLGSLDGWQTVGGQWIATGGAMRQNSANGDALLVRTAPAPDDQTVEVSLAFGFNPDDVAGVAARLDGNRDGYACVMNRDLNRLELRAVDNGVLAATLAQTAQTSPAVGSTFRLRFTLAGDALTCALVGGASAAASDTTHTSGRVGLIASGTRPTFAHVIAYQ